MRLGKQDGLAKTRTRNDSVTGQPGRFRAE